MEHKLGKRIAVIVLLAVVVVVILLLRICGDSPVIPSTDTDPTKGTLNFTPAGEQQNNTIKIPGMTGIVMQSGQLEQTVDFHNPKENTCYFVLSLYLSDDTGIVTGGFGEGRERITEIVLNQTLQRGIYGKCRLVYECYTLDNKYALNTGEVVLEINST